MPMPITLRDTAIPGVLVAQTGIARDERGYFAEVYSEKSFADAGFSRGFVQDNVSLSRKGVLRGLHYQLNPHAMGKLVRVLQGSVYDVAVDLRHGSPTFGRWVGETLSAQNGLALWVPEGFAHGFLALDDNTLVLYKCTAIHTPESERSVAYNDPAIGIEWPIEPTLVSEKDQAAPLLREAEHNFPYAARTR